MTAAPKEELSPDAEPGGATSPEAEAPAVKDPREPKLVPESLNGKSIDAAVRALFDVSWGEARKWIASGKITLSAERITQSTVWVRTGQKIALSMNARKISKGPELTSSQVVHIDSNVVVVNKPAGLSTIPFEEGEPVALDELLRTYLASHGRAKGRPTLGIVHRLDKDTSGLIVFTRTWDAKQSLSNQFRAHTVTRSYVAIAHGDVRAQTFRSHIVENRGDGIRGSIEAGFRGGRGQRAAGQGQLAITHVEPIERLKGATLILCRLETGRTHQIRIHLSEAGHPIVGERVYIRNFAGTPIEAPRHMLHARELGFVHPVGDEDVHYEAAPPADFEKVHRELAL